MSTAIKIDDEAKSKLEELQAEIRLKTGKRITQQELLSALIDKVVDSRSEFVDSFRGDSPELTEEEIEQLNEGRFASGVETDEEDIDEILYK